MEVYYELNIVLILLYEIVEHLSFFLRKWCQTCESLFAGVPSTGVLLMRFCLGPPLGEIPIQIDAREPVELCCLYIASSTCVEIHVFPLQNYFVLRSSSMS